MMIPDIHEFDGRVQRLFVDALKEAKGMSHRAVRLEHLVRVACADDVIRELIVRQAET